MPISSANRESILQRNAEVFGDEHPVAFITGSVAPRVGRVVAEYLYAHGFRVVLHSHDAPTSEERTNVVQTFGELDRSGPPLILHGNVEEEVQTIGWLTQILDRYQRVDVLVNSAAIWQPKPLEEVEPQDFERYFRVNTLSVALACKHFGLQMARQKDGGAIINFGDWAIARPYQDFAAYFPSKGGVVAVTQSMAVELATRNPRIRVNAILPGPVMLDDSIDEKRRQRLIEDCLLKREGRADDVAQAAYMLSTNPFITGVCVPVDGGRSLYAGPNSDAVAHPDVSL